MTPAPATPADTSGPLPVVLGSGSIYRRELLSRLLPAFDIVVPDVDETPQPGEESGKLALRLACLKAAAIAVRRPEAIVIGSDQVADCGGRILGKPGNRGNALAQLEFCAGRSLTLHTAVCVTAPGLPAPITHTDQTTLQFRPLSPRQIAAYVDRDRPLDCAGSFRFESLGAALFSAVRTSDPTAIQGLPLLWLTEALADAGVAVI